MFHDIVGQVWGNRVSLLAGQIVHRSLILVVQRENLGNQLQLLHFRRIAAVLLDVKKSNSDFQIFSDLPLDKSLCHAYSSVSKVANKLTSIRANSIHRCDEKLPASMITVPQIG